MRDALSPRAIAVKLLKYQARREYLQGEIPQLVNPLTRACAHAGLRAVELEIDRHRDMLADLRAKERVS